MPIPGHMHVPIPWLHLLHSAHRGLTLWLNALNPESHQNYHSNSVLDMLRKTFMGIIHSPLRLSPGYTFMGIIHSPCD